MSEPNTSAQAGTDNAQPSQSEPAYDPDFDDSPDEENTGETADTDALNSEPDEADSQESEPVADEDQATAESESEDAELPDTAKIKLPDGTVSTVKELREGYMRRDTFTRNSQQRETEYTQRFESVTNLQSRLDRTVDQIADFLSRTLPPEPDFALSQTNPSAYVAQNASYQAALRQVQSLLNVGQELKEAGQHIDQEKFQQELKTENAKLHERLPKLADKKVSDKFFGEVYKLGRDVGLTDAEMQNMTDHRYYVVLDLALDGMAAREAKRVAKAKVANVPPVAQPRRAGDQSAAKLKELQTKHRKSGSADDAVAYLLAADKG